MKLALDLLRADPANARRISDGALEGLAVSAETFGDLAGITWNEQLGLLVTGHQRMRILTAAGAEHWVREGDRACIARPKTGERSAIRIVRWDETTHRMAELTANNAAIQGEYVDEMAAAQLAVLEHDERFMALKLGELEAEISEALVPPAPPDTAGDDIPAPPAEPVTRPGDLWLLGEHRLLCGDCRRPEDTALVLGDWKINGAVTSPP